MSEEEFEERVEEREEPPKDICPLLTIAFRTLYPCLRERCAWWVSSSVTGSDCVFNYLTYLMSIEEVLEAGEGK